MLSILNLDKLTLHKNNLNQNAPVYQWPKVKSSSYKHINSIKNYSNVTIYDIDETNITDNIILQKIHHNEATYLMISTYGEPVEVIY